MVEAVWEAKTMRDPHRLPQPAAVPPANLNEPVEQELPDSPTVLSQKLVWWLDEVFFVPGTKFRFGLDPILSLVPVVGGAVPAALGWTILFDAIRLRAPIPVLTRMVFNAGIDWLIGSIPLIGNVFDFAWRCNTRNLKLLERTINDREQVRRASIAYLITSLAVVLGGALLLLGAFVASAIWLVTQVLGLWSR